MTLKPTHSILGAGALLACASLAGAQIVVPPLCAYTDGGGNTAQNVFNGTSTFRSQHIIRGDFLVPDRMANPVRLISAVSFRPDSGTQSIGAPYGGTFEDVVVKLSYTNYDQISIDTTFLTNIAGQPQFEVYNCSTGTDADVTIQPHSTTNDEGVAPWFTMVFSGANAPFIFQPGVVDPVFNPMGYDHLLIDIVSSTVAVPVNMPPMGTNNFIAIDGHQPGGKYRTIGQSGPFSCAGPFDNYRLNVSGGSINGNAGGNRAGMVPGDGYTVFADGGGCFTGPPFGSGPSDAMCALFLQIDTPPYPPLPAPIDLGFVGMPGQQLYINPIPGVEWGNTFAGSPIGGARASWTIDLSLAGIDPGQENWRILAQVATVDAGLTAPLTVAWSNAVEMYHGLTGGMAAHPTAQCAENDHTSPTGRIPGNFTSAKGYGAVIKIN